MSEAPMEQPEDELSGAIFYDGITEDRNAPVRSKAVHSRDHGREVRPPKIEIL